VSTTSSSETNLFVNATGESHVNSAGYIDVGEYAGGEGHLQWTETAGAAGTLKVYGSINGTATAQGQIGSDQTITAGGGDKPIVISSLPRYIRITITRSGANNITVKYILVLNKRGTL